MVFKKPIAFILFLCPFFNSLSKEKIDSLLVVLENHRQFDSIRVDILNELGFEYWIVDPAQSENFGSKAFELAEELGYIEGIAYARRVIGVSHWSRGNYELALYSLYDGLEKYKAVSNLLGQANCLLNIGLVYADRRDYERALEYYFDAEKAFQELGEIDRIATNYNKIGTIFIEQEKYGEALDYLLKALEIHKTSGFMYGISESNNRLGVLYYKKGELDKGLGFFFESLGITKENDDKHGTAANLNRIGCIYLEKKAYEMARKYLEEGKIYAKTVKATMILRDIYFNLKELYGELGQYQNAMVYFDLYSQMKDSIFNEEKAIQVANLQTKYELADKDRMLELGKKEIAILEQQARFDKIMRIGLIAGILILGLIAYLIISKQHLRIKRNKELLVKNQELYTSKQALTEAELENSKLKEKELLKELEFKNRELTSFTINFIQKNELMEALKENISEIKKISDDKVSGKLNSLNRLVDNSLHVDRNWEDFKLYFENVHSDFFKILKDYKPDLSNYELKLCALIRLNLNMKETATILGISAESVKTARYRLRKKLALSREENLIDFIMNLENAYYLEKPN